MAGRPKKEDVKIEEEVQEIKSEEVVEVDSEKEKLLKELEELKKQLAESKNIKSNKIPNDAEIIIKVGVNSSVYFEDKTGRINYVQKLDGIDEEDTIEFGDLKKIRSTSRLNPFLLKGYFLIVGDANGELEKDQIIKELRLEKQYSGKLNFDNIDEVLLEKTAEELQAGLDEVEKSGLKSSIYPILVERFMYHYKSGRIKDIDTIGKIQFIVKKHGGNLRLFD